MKLHAYLSRSRHGIFYFRWPLPPLDQQTSRKTLRLSLGTRCPAEAGRLARHLGSCGQAIEQQWRVTYMDHAKLRAAITDYFREQLRSSKARRNSIGPFTPDEREQAKMSLGLLEEGNSEYWHLLGREHAQKNLDDFFTASGLPRHEYASHSPVVLNEIRLGHIGVHKAILDYMAGLEAYDFSEPQGGALKTLPLVMATSDNQNEKAAQRPLIEVSGPLLHPKLIDLGILRYAEALKRSGEAVGHADCYLSDLVGANRPRDCETQQNRTSALRQQSGIRL